MAGTAGTVEREPAIKSSFTWAHVVVDTLMQRFNHAELQYNTLLGTCCGTSSDFSGGACGWECASSCLESAGHNRGLHFDLAAKSICDS